MYFIYIRSCCSWLGFVCSSSDSSHTLSVQFYNTVSISYVHAHTHVCIHTRAHTHTHIHTHRINILVNLNSHAFIVILHSFITGKLTRYSINKCTQFLGLHELIAQLTKNSIAKRTQFQDSVQVITNPENGASIFYLNNVFLDQDA